MHQFQLGHFTLYPQLNYETKKSKEIPTELVGIQPQRQPRFQGQRILPS